MSDRPPESRETTSGTGLEGTDGAASAGPDRDRPHDHHYHDGGDGPIGGPSSSSAPTPTADRDDVERQAKRTAVSLWYTYNQHYAAANGYRYLRLAIDGTTATMGGVLTYALVWRALSTRTMVALAVGVAVLAGIRSAVGPGRREQALRRSATDHKCLFEQLRDFLVLEVQSPEASPEYLDRRYREYGERRRRLIRSAPDVASVWYRYVAWRAGEDGPDDIQVTDAEVAAVLGRD